MALLVSSWSSNVESLPASYIMPPEKRPGNFVTVCEEIPVIDLGSGDQADLVRKIIDACQEFGLFQVHLQYISKISIGRYSIEVRNMGFRILDLIGKGLGLDKGYFDGELSQEQGMAINHYPPCPDPTLAMGIGSHTDPNLLTLLQQDEYGLQNFNAGRWVGVKPLPNAFVVNSGYQLQIISNGKLKSAEHRGVTNSRAARTSIVTFFGPSRSSTIEPAKELVTCTDPQRFKPYGYQEFLDEYLAYIAMPIPRAGTPLDPYKL